MKNLRYLLISASLCLGLSSCVDGEDIGFGDGWQEPLMKESPYGNNNIKETNVVTIKALKERFNTYINTSYSYIKVEEELQIKGYVTGNDVSGNIYNEVVIQDESNQAIIIAVSQGGIFGYLPVGTEIVVDLKGLYVGNYGKQAEIGVPYTNSKGNTYVSRMSRFLWQQHFKITGNKKVIEPVLFADGAAGGTTSWSLEADGGKLGIIKNVSFRDITPNSLFADPDAGESMSYYFNEFSGKTIMIYTSPYCDFAGRTMPQGKCNITGIVKRYNNSWEFIIRDENDIEEIK